MADACVAPRERLDGIFPGSWIDANFYIWIGHADDQRAWGQVAAARQVLDEASADVDAHTLAQARQEMFIAEGSDWCWWYGDDHSSDHDAEFDDLFRRHLRNVYRLLKRPIPEELFVSNISSAAATDEVAVPTGLVSPVVDGESTSYFEWLGAGRLDVRDVAGAMHQADRDPSLLTQVHFGFGGAELFLRLDAHRPALAWLGEGRSVVVSFLAPTQTRLTCRLVEGRVAAFLDDAREASRGQSDVRVAAGSILELAVPLERLSADATGSLSFFVAVHGAAGVELERHPSGRPVAAAIPDASFSARNWTA